jgi:hypothetical protein
MCLEIGSDYRDGRWSGAASSKLQQIDRELLLRAARDLRQREIYGSATPRSIFTSVPIGAKAPQHIKLCWVTARPIR